MIFTLRKVFFISFLYLISTTSCSQKINHGRNAKINIVDSLMYVKTLPNEYFYPKGDSICAKILSNPEKYAPYLIEKIDDTISSKFKYADYFFYKTGDIALELLSTNYKSNEFPLRKLMIDEFKIKNENDPFNLIFYNLFHINSNFENLKNRKKIKQKVIEWFKNHPELISKK